LYVKSFCAFLASPAANWEEHDVSLDIHKRLEVLRTSGYPISVRSHARDVQRNPLYNGSSISLAVLVAISLKAKKLNTSSISVFSGGNIALG